jgi:hypothetical protein
VRESEVEPVLCELMRYFERDEARHVGLGMQYLPSLLKDMNRREVSQMITFQVRLLAWALWENKVLEDDLRTLGIDARMVIERARRKQLAALQEAFDALGIPVGEDRNVPAAALNAVIELMFPTDDTRGDHLAKAKAAWKAFLRRDVGEGKKVFEVHKHRIKTARGWAA